MSPAPPSPGAAEGLLARVGREIEAEVRELRLRGVFPPSFERRLDDLFAQAVPTGAVEAETEEALRYLESVSHVDIEVPLGSRIPAGAIFKHLMRPLMAWYLNYVARQVNSFMGASVRLTRLLAERVTAIEESSSVFRSASLAPAERGPGVDLGDWTDLVRVRLAGAPGPVLHAECGKGSLVRLLVSDGLEAYGLDPCADLLDEVLYPSGAAASGGFGSASDGSGAAASDGSGAAASDGPAPDLRWADVADHLWGLPDGSLGGLVLSGCVDRMEVGAQRELAATAAAKVGLGGVVVVIGTSPGAWLARRLGLASAPAGGVVEADLAPGRPLHPETWAWLLASEGLNGVEVFWSPEQGSEPGPAAEVSTGASVVRLAEMISGPTSFAVVASRPEARMCARP